MDWLVHGYKVAGPVIVPYQADRGKHGNTAAGEVATETNLFTFHFGWTCPTTAWCLCRRAISAGQHSHG